MADLPESLPSLDVLTAEPFGVEVDKGGRKPADGSPRRRFTDQDKDRALMVLISVNEDLQKAHEITGVAKTTLSTWKSKLYADRYHELRVRYGKELEERCAAEMKAAVGVYNEVERETLFRLREEIPNLSPIELAKTLKEVSMARSKLVHTYMTLEGRPTQVTEQRSYDAIERRLVELGAVEAEVIENDETPAG